MRFDCFLVAALFLAATGVSCTRQPAESGPGSGHQVPATPTGGTPSPDGKTSPGARSPQVDALVDRLQKESAGKQDPTAGGGVPLTDEERKELLAFSSDFCQALLEEGVRYVGALLKDEELKTYYADDRVNILAASRRTSIEGSRRMLQDWIGGAPCEFGTPVIENVEHLKSGGKNVARIVVPYKASFITGEVSINGVVKTPEGWKILIFTVKKKRL